MARWLLPENISDVLPLEARRVEDLRRRLLELYRVHGYALVMPPLVEYLDSLLTGTGSELDLLTFKLVDQASGRMLGLRADITPQVARIDAHILNRSGVTRLCYAGSVLHARPLHPLASREPLQVGAELFGHAGLAADREILQLAVRSLRAAGLTHVHLDLGHTAVLRALLADGSGARPPADDILAALIAKDWPALRALVAPLAEPVRSALLALPELQGDVAVLERARRVLPALPSITTALDDLAVLARDCGADEVSIDFGDLHGFRYKTGPTFSAYVRGLPAALLRGGRYDDVGRAFGRARPATGFSVYLRELATLHPWDTPRAILAPAVADAALDALMAAQRAAGEVVVQRLQGEAVADAAAGEFEFDREIVALEGQWTIVPLRAARKDG